MIHCVYGHDELVAQFVAQMIPLARIYGFPRASKAIGVVDDDRLVAGWVFHNWQPEAGVIEVSCAAIPGARWLTRRTVRELFAYPFGQLQCQMVVGRVDVDDERLLRQLAGLGFSIIRIPRMLGRDHDGMVCLLTIEDWAAHRINRALPVKVKYEPLLEEAA